jgi:tetratricopeptide (TPR) repeat protein
MRRTICEQEPARPSTRLSTMLDADLTTIATHRHCEPAKLGPLLRGDLDWIVMKALEKDRTRRYETANGLAADVQRHLDNEPVIARPPSNLYRFQKLIRRNKLAFAAASAVLGALLLGLSLSTWLFVRERAARQEAVIAGQRQATLRAQAEEAQTNERDMRNKVGNEMNDVGIQFMNEGKLEVAEVVLRRALALHKELLSNDDGNTIVAVGNLTLLLNSQGRQRDAETLVDELLPPAAEKRIESYGTLCFRAQYRVHSGRFDDAALDMAKALKLKPDDGVAWLRLATIFIQAGDINAYHQLRQAMFARFGAAAKPRLAEVTAKTCLLLPWSDNNSNLVQQLADRVASELPTDKWAGLTKGLSDYRQGRFEGAVEWERRALAASDADKTLEVAARALLGMAQYRLGKFNEASNSFVEAGAIAAKQMAKLSPLNTFAENWHNILTAKILLQEAGNLIEVESPVPPDPQTLNTVAWQLATSPLSQQRNGKRAVALAEQAAKITNRKDPLILDTLAAAYAEAGDYPKAVNAQREAVALSLDASAKQELAGRLKLYETSTPYRGPQTRVQRFVEKYSYQSGYFAKYARQDRDLWKECMVNSPKVYYFDELQRDQEFIILRDASRNFRVQIPVQGGMSKLSMDDGNSWRKLYDLQKE